MDKERVVITGIGIITSLGRGIQQNFSKLIDCQTGIKHFKHFNSKEYKSSWYSYCDEDIDKEFSDKENRRFERSYKMLEIAAKEAAIDAQLIGNGQDAIHAGIYLGSIMAGDEISHQRHKSSLEGRVKYRHCAYFAGKNSYADLLSSRLNLVGPRMMISTACTASSLAIIVAAQHIVSNQVGIAFVGGVDPISEFIFAGFHNMRNVSNSPCSPFSLPEGMTLGEGAGFLILERLDHALARQANIYAELLGFAMTADAYHPTSPDTSGVSHKILMEKAIRDSSLNKSDIDYINLHGTGTKANDKTEALGLKLVFNTEANKVPCSSIKGSIGHTLGGAGTIEAALTIMAVKQQQLLPNIGYTEPRDDCNISIIKEAVKTEINVALSNAYAFGGNNACLALGKYQRERTVIKRKANRVVITGIGVISPLGNSKDSLLQNSGQGLVGLRYYNQIPYLGITGSDDELENYFNYDARRADRLGKIILAATQLAFNDAQLDATYLNHNPLGIISGTSYAHLASSLSFNEMVATNKPLYANPFDFANSVANSGCGLASINLGAKGCNISVCSGQMSGNQSITLGYELIKEGKEKILICGGADSLDGFILEAIAAVFKTSRAKDLEQVNALLCEKNEKTLFGEGACYFVLESLTDAEARGAKIYCEINGYHNYAKNSSQSLFGDIEETLNVNLCHALKHSSKNKEEIDVVLYANLLTAQQYIAEKKVIENFFTDKVLKKSFSSLFGVSAAMGPLAMAALINSRINFTTALLNSMSFGGAACSLVISAWE